MKIFTKIRLVFRSKAKPEVKSPSLRYAKKKLRAKIVRNISYIVILASNISDGSKILSMIAAGILCFWYEELARLECLEATAKGY